MLLMFPLLIPRKSSSWSMPLICPAILRWIPSNHRSSISRLSKRSSLPLVMRLNLRNYWVKCWRKSNEFLSFPKTLSPSVSTASRRKCPSEKRSWKRLEQRSQNGKRYWNPWSLTWRISKSSTPPTHQTPKWPNWELNANKKFSNF